MKMIYRYLIGIIAGLAAGFLLKTGQGTQDFLEVSSRLTLSFGRYLLLPLVFFSLPVAVTRLRREAKLGILLGRSSLYALLAGAILTVVGTLLTWTLDIGRVPVVPGSSEAPALPNIIEMIEQIFQPNGFRILIGNPSFLLPLLIPAFLLGWHFNHDKEISEPAFNFFDSMSRLLYRANRYLLLLMPVFLALLTTQIVINSRTIVDFSRFLPLLAYLSITVVVLIIGIYPAILWIAGGRRSPWKALAGMSGSLLGALVSGSPLFNYGNLTLHLKENLAVPRENAALLAPIYLMFARAGTAMVSAACMLTIIRSYSSLEVTLFQAAWTALFAFLISFALPATPDRGLTTSLIVLGSLYGRGLDDSWLILAPVLPLIAMLTTLLDTATGAFLILISTRRARLERDTQPALRI